MSKVNYFISFKDGKYQSNFEFEDDDSCQSFQERLIRNAGAEIVYRGGFNIELGCKISERINAIEGYVDEVNRTGVFDAELLEKRICD